MTTMTLHPGNTFPPGPGVETLDELAWAIDSDGIARHEATVSRLANWARALGLDSVLVDVLADPAQPEAARERAFGALSQAVARPDQGEHRPSDPRRFAA